MFLRIAFVLSLVASSVGCEERRHNQDKDPTLFVEIIEWRIPQRNLNAGNLEKVNDFLGTNMDRHL
ncbi:hypothetical protein GCM10009114_02220 [Aliiglaciecola litoralis]|uniref:Uncharacterized protein n=1 Tax=Aliiglaciecola litoralis TaxID=582857 RepID=A0ABN1LCI5_9ALTE